MPENKDADGPSDINNLSEIVIGCAIRVHKLLGPGLLESAYEKALSIELRKSAIKFETQVTLPFVYDGITIDEGYKIDLLIEDTLIIELKSVKNIEDVHLKQLLTYLKLSGKRLGLLINFNAVILKEGIRRVING